MLLRHDVDRLGRASSASNESASLELLQTLYAVVGAAICGAQTNAATQFEHVALCDRRLNGHLLAPHGKVAVKVAVSCAAGPAQHRCIHTRGHSHPHPVP